MYCVIHRIEIYPVESVIADIDVSFQHPTQQFIEGVSAIGLSKLPQLI